MELIRLDTVDSTNEYVKRLGMQGAAHGTAVTAAVQTGGKGRLGRSFASPEGGIYLSVLLRPDCAPDRLFSLTPSAAVAVCQALEQECGISPDIKWPNDLLLGGGKLCGILTEAVTCGSGFFAVLGIGLNVNTDIAALPPELRRQAVSVQSVTGRQTDCEALCAAILCRVEQMYCAWCADEKAYLPRYREKCVSIGRQALILRGNEAVPCRTLCINDDFSLKAELDGGRIENISFGEVSLR